MLTKEEWGRLEFNDVSPASRTFAKFVIEPQLEKFWNKLDNNNFTKTKVPYYVDSELHKSYEITICELLDENKFFTIDEIITKTKINRGYCIKSLTKLYKEQKIIKSKLKGKVSYKRK
jgi:hypothetical protein